MLIRLLTKITKIMKTFLFKTTTNDTWEICNGSYLVNAESKEEAESIFEINKLTVSIQSIKELNLSVKGTIKIQKAMVI